MRVVIARLNGGPYNGTELNIGQINLEIYPPPSKVTYGGATIVADGNEHTDHPTYENKPWHEYVRAPITSEHVLTGVIDYNHTDELADPIAFVWGRYS